MHFSTGNYTRALSFLSRRDLIASSPSCRYLAAHCAIKQGNFDEALAILGDKNPTHLITAPGSARRKLQHVDANIRNGAAAKAAKSTQRSERVDRREERDKEDVASIRFEAAMCYLRGVCFAKQNAFDRAKECYKDAVRIDVQCFEAFDQLMKNSLMSPSEEWEFLQSLDFDTISVSGAELSVSQEAAEFTKMLYTTRLSKYTHPADLAMATETLSTHYNLSTNPDILLSKASLLFTQCRFRDALDLTNSILATDRYNFSAIPLHLALLHSLNQKNALFLLSHDLADTHPNEPCTYLAIGVYYLTISQIPQARRFFSKASMMDPHFGAAWIGFAHTFAAEGEHEQAISAYSTAARLFQGTHLPPLFLGMQNLLLNNLPLAEEYLHTAWDICESDPLLLNELGVVAYHRNDLDKAIQAFTAALTMAAESGSEPAAWVATRSNLGHALRRTGRYEEALAEFDDVLRQGGKDATVFSSRALCLLEKGDAWNAVIALHEALAVSPQDPIATELLSKALEANEEAGFVEELEPRAGGSGLGDEDVDRILGRRAAAARKGKGKKKGGSTGLYGNEADARFMEEMGERMMVDDGPFD